MGVDAHRTGAIEREDRRDVGEAVGTHQPEQRPHRSAVELEDAERVAGAEELVGRRVVERQGLEDQLLAAVDLDVLERVVEDGEVAQPEEVHLDQAQGFAGRVVELGDHGAVGGPLEQRDHVGQRLARHDHPGGVHAPLPLQSLDAEGGVDDLLDVRVGVVERAELAPLAEPLVLGVEHVLERDVLAHHRRRHRLGDPVAHRERVAQDATGVLDRLLGLDRAVGDDHGDPIVAVLVGDVADHLTAPTLVEVDVEVGHRDPLGVQEPLEQQPVHQRVEIGDPQCVGDDRPGTGAAARPHPDALLLRPVDEVGDHQEVAGEPHLEDHADLEVGPGARLGGHAIRVANGQSALHLGQQPGVLGVPLRAGEARHVGAVALGELHVAALGDQQGVVAGLAQVVLVDPDRPHLLGRLQVVAVAGEREPLARAVAGRDVHRGARVDAQQVLLRGRVLTHDVVAVVGGQQRDPQVLRELEQPVADPLLDLEAVVHQLQEVVVAAEDVLEVGRRLPRGVVVVVAQVDLDLAARAAGGADQPGTVRREQLAVDAGVMEVAVLPGAGGDPEQVVHPRGGLAEQGQVGVGAARGDVVGTAVVEVDPPLVAAGDVGGRVGLDADDRLDPRGLGLRVEVVGAEHVAVVGHRDRGHPELRGPPGQVTEAGGAVEHGVLGVHVEVDEGVPGASRHLRVMLLVRSRSGMTQRHRVWGPAHLTGEERQTTGRKPDRTATLRHRAQSGVKLMVLPSSVSESGTLSA